MTKSEIRTSRNWKSRTSFVLILLTSLFVSNYLVRWFQTPSIMVVNAVPIILCGWLFGKHHSFYAAFFLFVTNGLYFKLAHLDAFIDPKGLFLGVVSYSIFSTAGFSLRSIRELYEKIHLLNDEINAKNRELREVTMRDPLTALHNRRYVDECVTGLATTFLQQLSTPEFAMRQLGLEDKVILVMIADIDHFKRINDVHGHGAGDQALVEISRRIKQAVRFDDTVIRWGGEEFLIVCSMVNKSNAEMVIRKVLEGSRSKPIVLADGTRLDLTLSVGAVWLPVFPTHPAAVAFEKSILLADKALYDAKQNGRNHGRLVVALENSSTAREGRLPDSMDEFYADPGSCMISVVGNGQPAAG